MERKNSKLTGAFAKVLKGRRKSAGLSQEELAFRVNLSVSYISLLETENRQPTLTVIGAIAAEFGISISEFMSEVEQSIV
jgi:transcriptional regulator with XRE-family HTH domain